MTARKFNGLLALATVFSCTALVYAVSGGSYFLTVCGPGPNPDSNVFLCQACCHDGAVNLLYPPEEESVCKNACKGANFTPICSSWTQLCWWF